MDYLEKKKTIESEYGVIGSFEGRRYEKTIPNDGAKVLLPHENAPSH